MAASLLDVHLESGRTHQIRVHFSALHHPCCGDLTYGADPTLAKRFGLERQWLHARSLAFAHPADGRRIEITSPYPADLQHALDVLRHHERDGPVDEHIPRTGVLFGVGAVHLWGLCPGYFPLLLPAGPWRCWLTASCGAPVSVGGARRGAAAWRPAQGSGHGPGFSWRRRRCHLNQLGHLHLCGEARARRRRGARILHQPAGDGRDSGCSSSGSGSGRGQFALVLAVMAVVVLSVESGQPPYLAGGLAFSSRSTAP